MTTESMRSHKPLLPLELTPKFVSMLREGYSLAHMRADVMAGLTVAIVALPLSMAIAIGSGAKPEQGLYAALIGGFVISLLGGSRFQIGGPAGAFIVLVASTINRFGYEGLMLATVMAGIVMLMIGYLRLGTYIKYIPHAVTIGFTAGIGCIIFAGEIHDLLGLQLAHEPAALTDKIIALWDARSTLSYQALGLSMMCIIIISVIQRINSRLPSLLVAILAASLVTWVFNLPVETIGSRFGSVPSTLPHPHMPIWSLSLIISIIPSALAIALLGSIESLLSAVVADGMSGRHHRPNCELVAQGWANIASSLCGGLCVTGTIARTATNVRAHAHGPMSGIFHALFIGIFIVIAAPLAAYIPLAALAAVLALVAYNMVEGHEILTLFRTSRAEAFVFAVTVGLTVFRDLTEGIGAGVTLGALLFMHRMAEIARLEKHDTTEDDKETVHSTHIALYRLSGPFFFGVTSAIAAQMDLIGRGPKVFVLDMSEVPFVDMSGVKTLSHFAARAHQHGAHLCIMAAPDRVKKTLRTHGLNEEKVHYINDLRDKMLLGLLPP
jgi:sulfate permease, SulP family